MVAIESRQVNEFGLCSGLDLPNGKTLSLHGATLKQILFGLCKVCQDRAMACIPPSAFTAKQIRESQKNMKVSKLSGKDEPSPKYFHSKLQELNPLQYNSKMMNSIWGLYNRYSSHNVKTNNDVLTGHSVEAQPSAAASNKTEFKPQPAKAKFDNIWAAFNFSQSH